MVLVNLHLVAISLLKRVNWDNICRRSSKVSGQSLTCGLKLLYMEYLLGTTVFVLLIILLILVQNIGKLRSQNAVWKEKHGQQEKVQQELKQALEASHRQSDHLQDLNLENAKLSAQISSLSGQLQEAKRSEDDLKQELEIGRREMMTAKEVMTVCREENKHLKTKLQDQAKELEQMGEKFTHQFEVLANRILEEKSIKFSSQNKESLEQLLGPLGKEFGEFKKKVEETYDKESKQRFSLEEKVKDLMALNQQISLEAKNLTQALKGNSKTQGNWGEAILETILQNSGLERNRHYAVQEFLKDDAGQYILGPNGKRMQPDVTITYPDQRKVIIDSKVSLLAYEQYFNSEQEDLKELALKNHLKSIRTHVDQLSAKQYDGYAKALDFVIMFVPMEAAYITAVQADANLWEYAYKKRILLISSSNLIAALKMIKDLWVRTDQTQNALDIADRGGKLYDKFVGFLNNLEDIGKHLENSQNSYGEAMKQLKTGNGNLIGQVEKLKKLGVKANSSIPEQLLQK